MDAKTGSIEGGCPVPHDGGVRALLGRTNKDWWPEMLATEILNPNGPTNPYGDDFDYAEAFNAARLQGAQAGPHRPDDRQPAVVAGGLRPLRPVLHPHGLARGGHLPHRRRPRRRQQRPAALRPARQLARQRQSRQGAPPAVADQAEVRQEHQLGRPVHPRRQRRDREHGRADLRLRRRPRRRV